MGVNTLMQLRVALQDFFLCFLSDVTVKFVSAVLVCYLCVAGVTGFVNLLSGLTLLMQLTCGSVCFFFFLFSHY